jgi:hypothetical protein
MTDQIVPPSPSDAHRVDNQHQGSNTGFFGRLLHELMSNQYRGYAGLRDAGGVHPVSNIGTETGGHNATFAEAELAAAFLDAIRDGVRAGTDHTLNVQANGPFSGYVLPGHTFQAAQYAFPALGATDTPMPARIVNAHPMRLDVMIKVVTLSSGSFYVGSSETLNSQNGYPLAAGEVITIPARSEIWAISTSTSQAILATLSTLREG